MAGSGTAGASDPRPATIVAMPRGDRAFLLVVAPLVGGLVGLALPLVAGQLGRIPVLPFGPLLRGLAGLDRGWELAVPIAVATAAGLALAVVAILEAGRLVISETQLCYDRERRARVAARSDVAVVYPDRGKLVVLDRASRVLIAGPLDAAPDVLAAALRAHGYPWADADPYADLYRPWRPDAPELPDTVNALLAARQIAVERRSRRDIDDLGDAVQKLGYVVRTDGRSQFWRPLVQL